MNKRNILSVIILGSIIFMGGCKGCNDKSAHTLPSVRKDALPTNTATQISNSDHEIFSLIEEDQPEARARYLRTRITVKGYVSNIRNIHRFGDDNLGIISILVDNNFVIAEFDHYVHYGRSIGNFVKVSGWITNIPVRESGGCNTEYFKMISCTYGK